MAVQRASAVTPERLAKGVTWQEWLGLIDRNQEKFHENYAACTIDAADVEAIKALMKQANGPVTVMALGECGCPDVYRGLPVMQKLCEATGLDLRILFRDQNLDIMDEFLYKDEYRSMPTFVFYTKDTQYIGHWIERAKKAREEYGVLREITAKINQADITPEAREAYTQEYAAFQRGPVWDGWRRAQVTEMRALLEAGCPA